MTLTVTQEYNSWQAPGTWYTLTPTQTHTVVCPQYCAEHEFGWVYKKTGSCWVWTKVHAGADTSQPAPNTWQYVQTRTYALAAGIAGYSYYYTEVGQSGSNPPVTQGIVTRMGDAELFPAGAKFEKGESVTVHAKLTVNRSQSWDSIIEFPSAASRNLGG